MAGRRRSLISKESRFKESRGHNDRKSQDQQFSMGNGKALERAVYLDGPLAGTKVLKTSTRA